MRDAATAGDEMDDRRRWMAYVSLWVFALAFGGIEASVVVYLRELDVSAGSLHQPSLASLQVTLVSLPLNLVGLEIARETCTMLVLGAVACLGGVRAADRAGSFLLAFGIWDLTYYAVLKAVLGWPDSLNAWDILFLIPAPWVAPVWAPMVVAILFVGTGSYLFWTAARERRYRPLDVTVLLASALLTIVVFLIESSAAVDHRVPDRFQTLFFLASVALGVTWFISVERRLRRRMSGQPG